MKKLYFLFALLILFVQTPDLSATDLIIQFSDGSEIKYKVADIEKITFSLLELNIFSNKAVDNSISTVDINKIYFNYRTAVDAPENINQIIVFPNPTAGELNFQNIPNNIRNFQILDLSGQKVYEGNFQNSLHSINISSFKNGIYFIVIENNLHKIIKL